MTDREFKPLGIAVLTASDSRDDSTDKSGHLLVERLRDAGHRLIDKVVVPDDIYAIRANVSQWIYADAVSVVLTTGGGTGVTGSRRHAGSGAAAFRQDHRRLR